MAEPVAKGSLSRAGLLSIFFIFILEVHSASPHKMSLETRILDQGGAKVTKLHLKGVE